MTVSEISARKTIPAEAAVGSKMTAFLTSPASACSRGIRLAATPGKPYRGIRPQTRCATSGTTLVSQDPEDVRTEVLPALRALSLERLEDPSRLAEERKLWKAAVKLPMYWVAAAPALVSPPKGASHHGFGPLPSRDSLRLSWL